MSRQRRRTTLVLAFTIAALALAFARPAHADTVGPVVSLGPTTVLNGVAVVSGTVGEPMSGATLSVNGQPLTINAAGQFAGTSQPRRPELARLRGDEPGQRAGHAERTSR